MPASNIYNEDSKDGLVQTAGSAYIGSELDVFAHAVNWKHYWSSEIAGYIGHEVLEVGVGLGSNTSYLVTSRQRKWVALDPDPILVQKASEHLAGQKLPIACEVRVGTLDNVAADEYFDTILYIDVLEHIQDDRGELQRAALHLEKGGSIVVLAPAHQTLFSPFDKAIGHYRRYDKKMMTALNPDGLFLKNVFYLDSCGLLASLANARGLKASSPSVSQIKLWDSVLVRASRLVDPLIGRRMGKSIVGVWQRRDT